MENTNKSMIYMAQCTIKKELIYIGKTHQLSIEDRIMQHEQKARSGDSTPFHQAMIDYGLKNWEWSVLEICNIEDEFEKEKEFINKIGAAPIELLNVSYAKIDGKKKGKNYSSKLIKKTSGIRVFPMRKVNSDIYLLVFQGNLNL